MRIAQADRRRQFTQMSEYPFSRFESHIKATLLQSVVLNNTSQATYYNLLINITNEGPHILWNAENWPKTQSYNADLVDFCRFIQNGFSRSTTLNPFPNDKIWILSNWKTLQMTISKLMKRAEGNQDRWKTLWEKEEFWAISPFPTVFSKELTADT